MVAAEIRNFSAAAPVLPDSRSPPKDQAAPSGVQDTVRANRQVIRTAANAVHNSHHDGPQQHQRDEDNNAAHVLEASRGGKAGRRRRYHLGQNDACKGTQNGTQKGAGSSRNATPPGSHRAQGGEQGSQTRNTDEPPARASPASSCLGGIANVVKRAGSNVISAAEARSGIMAHPAPWPHRPALLPCGQSQHQPNAKQ